MTRLHRLGAHVFFGDWDATAGGALSARLSVSTSGAEGTGGTVHFSRLDVRDYASQLALFDAARSEHGRVDAAVSCAAVSEPTGGWFDPADLDLVSVRTEPTPVADAVTINLTSVLHFVRIALAYTTEASSSSPSITLVSSIAGITEAPGLFAYAAAKHGVVGLMRALRPWAPALYGVRVNALCPWATDTQMLAGPVRERWVAEAMPLNVPDDVARLICQCVADPSLNGRAIFVTGGRGFDTEEGVDRTRPLWMGEQNAADFDKGQAILGLVSSGHPLVPFPSFCLHHAGRPSLLTPWFF